MIVLREMQMSSLRVIVENSCFRRFVYIHISDPQESRKKLSMIFIFELLSHGFRKLALQ